MDIIITIILLVIAIAMVLGKPLKVEVEHKYPQNTQPVVDNTEQQKKLDEDTQPSLDEVVAAINDVMGVEYYGDDRKA